VPFAGNPAVVGGWEHIGRDVSTWSDHATTSKRCTRRLSQHRLGNSAAIPNTHQDGGYIASKGFTSLNLAAHPFDIWDEIEAGLKGLGEVSLILRQVDANHDSAGRRYS
jgi:hypothetical protein